MSPTNKSTWQFIKFAIVGITGTVIDFGILNLLTVSFGWEKIASQAISFMLAVMNNFILNRYWTYPEYRTMAFWKQFFRFLMISLIGLGIRTPLFWILSKTISLLVVNNHFTLLNLSPDVIANNLALAVCVVIVLLWNFFANRKWTFQV